MFPYLRKISEANHIADPFDTAVVEAYWIGNHLLEGVSEKQVYAHLKDSLKLDKSLKVKEFRQLEEKIGAGTRLHHSFHVFNVWKRTGNDSSYHTLESMDKCRISWGKIIAIDGPSIKVLTQPLIMDGRGLLSLGPETEKQIIRKLHDDYMMEVTVGDIISMHWDVPCEIITPEQKQYLERYTLLSIHLANQHLQ